MQAFNYDKANELLSVSDEHQMEAMIAIGRPGRKEDLPIALQEREIPSGRKKVDEITWEGGFSL
jgi:hypothetical protein